jgi:hypothetical protein
MARVRVSTVQPAALSALLRRIIQLMRRLAFAGAGAAAVLVLLLARGGYAAEDVVLAPLLFVPPAILLFFAVGVGQVLALPERLRRVPAEGQEQLGELARLGRDAQATRALGLPLLLWRLRGAIGSLRGVVGFALPLRVFTPWFLGLAAVSALLCVVLLGVAVIALIAAAFG